MATLRSATKGDENGCEEVRSLNRRWRRYRPITFWCVQPVRERGQDVFWELKIEAPAARWEARKGKTVLLSNVLRLQRQEDYMS